MKTKAQSPFAIAFSIFLASVLLGTTFTVRQRVERAAQFQARTVFDNRIDEIKEHITQRLREHESLLRGGVGLFSSVGDVTRIQWRQYVSALELNQSHPGIQGVGFSVWLKPSEKAANLTKIQAEGFSEYTIKPDGVRNIYTPIIYLEPFDWRNQRALGYDMYSEPVRRLAINMSVDSGTTSISGKITLVQETEKDKQNGILMFVPVYHKKALIDTVANRRAAIRGLVYSPIRLKDFVTATLGGYGDGIQFEIFDGPSQSDAQVLYRSTELQPVSADYRSMFSQVETVEIFGSSKWLFTFKTLPGFDKATKSNEPAIFLVFGTLLSFLLSYGAFATLSSRKKTFDLVKERTKQLTAEKAFQKLIFDSTAEAIYGIDLDGKCTFSNQACGYLLGYSKEDELIGQNMHSLIHHSYSDGKQYPVEQCKVYLAFETGQKSHCDTEVLWRKDGSSFAAEYWSYPQYSEGKIMGAVVTFLDVTARIESEFALRESEQAFRNQFEQNSSVMLLINASDGSLIDVNLAAVKFYGYSAEKMKKMRITDISTWPAERVMAKMKAASLSPAGTQFESRHRQSDGWVRDVSVSTSRIVRSTGLTMLSIINDITQSKAAEEKVKQLSNRLALATKASGIGVWEYDIGHNTLHWDSQMFELYGMNEKQFGGAYSAWRSGLHPDDRARGDQEVGLAIAGSKEFDTEFRVVWPDESIHHIRALAVIQRDDTGNALKMVGTNWEITQQKQTEASLKRAVATKSEFLANMSHEIRTPMNGVIGMTQLLLNTQLDRNQRRYAETIHSSGESLLTLIDDILDFSKIEANKLNLESIDFELRALLDGFTPALAHRAHQKSIEFICATATEIPTHFRGDPHRLLQVVNNLVSNAIKFTHQGEIVVRVSTLEESDADALMRFSVTDTGIGIAPDRIGLLFEKFSQADTSTTRKYGGTGLGLTISRQLVQMMSGNVGVESREGQGSEFWFTVRLPKQKSSSKNLSSFSGLAGKRILVVDDNKTNRELLITQLTNWGLVAEEASDGFAALLAAQRAHELKTPFDAILLDMLMPGMDGLEFASKVKNEVNLKSIRLILMTSEPMHREIKKSEQINFCAQLPKPVGHAGLADCLGLVFDKQSSAGGEAPVALATQSDAEGVFEKSSRILVVEDNETNQEVALGILKLLGLHADIAANGVEAIQVLISSDYDLVLMDVQMPELDGYETTQLIRDSGSAVRNHRIPVIAMTANALEGARQKCLDAGMNDYITKPIDAKHLEDRLKHWLPFRATKTMKNETAAIELFNSQVLLDRVQGDDQIARQIVEVFLTDTPARIEELQAYLTLGDLKKAGIIAHGIKGSATAIGAEKMSAVAKEIEKLAHLSNLEGVKSLMNDLRTSHLRSQVQIKKWRKT